MKKIIAIIVISSYTCVAIAQNQAYRGGSHDGYAADSLQNFSPSGYILKFSPYRGGIGDGYSSGGQLNFNQYNYIGKFSPYAGGNNDGWTGQPVINIISISNYTSCGDTTLTIVIQNTGVSNSGNIYTVQLSNNAGSFANPDTVGSLSSQLNTTSISVTLPSNLITGTYFIRVVSSNQPIIGFAKSINYSTKPNLGADTTLYVVCHNEVTNLTTLFNTSGLSMNWGTVTPTTADTGIYQIIATNVSGCKDTVVVTIKQDVATWVGNVNNDWHTASNWNTNRIPNEKTHVIINAGTPNTCTINNTLAKAASMQLKNGATFIVINNNDLTIYAKCSLLPLP
jgi:hypothetical protein